jgi:hypothetical protein
MRSYSQYSMIIFIVSNRFQHYAVNLMELNAAQLRFSTDLREPLPDIGYQPYT